ncbi:MAG TPA: tetratricopeptide repeat protein [Xanthobacteraceae bacterium]|nr:tetratricopeptide repeat protein [Xanthobacteraceae bacterium]
MNRHFRVLGLFAAIVLIGFALALGPAFSAGDDGTRPPAPGSGSGDKDKDKKGKQSENELRDGYLKARAMILDGKYESGIVALRALHYDDSPDVANYLGYANRKLGNYEAAKYWYEKALASDPNHVRTWQYYGMLQVERGNMLKAAEHLQKIKELCGTDCKEYADLKSAMEGHVRY